METKKIKRVLDLHCKWLAGEETGERANLQGANLQGANLQRADLREANLQGANLQRADLREANLDFSVWPLWYGTKTVKVSIRFVYQLLAHVSSLDCDDADFQKIKELILPYAQKSHRAGELGI